MRLIKPALIATGLLIAVAGAASPAMARDGHGGKHHWKHRHHHHHHYVGPPARYLSAPVVVERPVIYRAVPDYGYGGGYGGGYYGPSQPSLNLNIPLR